MKNSQLIELFNQFKKYVKNVSFFLSRRIFLLFVAQMKDLKKR